MPQTTVDQTLKLLDDQVQYNAEQKVKFNGEIISLSLQKIDNMISALIIEHSNETRGGEYEDDYLVEIDLVKYRGSTDPEDVVEMLREDLKGLRDSLDRSH